MSNFYRDGEKSPRPIGTELDAVAIAIARRLIFTDSRHDGEAEEPDSPLQAIVYANDHARDSEIL
ncbi:unnamed protein product [Strongylus vulgaris]|uniref:Uncharacterized protein n=1 Tax=Strongylus vulgaris TaxID=40348 RepID=A0A3P7ID40_STRVU|nr:unnamed protein product [Strongylus vulgaris]